MNTFTDKIDALWDEMHNAVFDLVEKHGADAVNKALEDECYEQVVKYHPANKAHPARIEFQGTMDDVANAVDALVLKFRK